MKLRASTVCAALAATLSTTAIAQAATSVHPNTDGSAHAVQVRPADPATFRGGQDALFIASPQTLRAALIDWGMAQAGLLGRNNDASGAPARPEITESRREPARFGDLSVHFFDQTYRGHPVLGSGQRVSVTIAPDGRVLNVTGRLVDPGIDYAGLEYPIDAEEARRAATKAWAAAGFNADSIVRRIGYVAVPERDAMAWLAEFANAGNIVGRALIHAGDGSVLRVEEARHEDAFDHRSASVMAYLMVDDPDTQAVQLYGGQPASTFGGCQPPWYGGCFLRMGDDRFAVYDFELDNGDAPAVWLTTECQFTGQVGNPSCFPWAMFNEADTTSFEFKTQDLFHKMGAALAFYDPIMNPIGWEHDPDAPFSLFEAPPLSVLTNVDSSPEGDEPDSCDGALGWFAEMEFGPEWDVVEHPWVTGDYKTSGIVMCKQDEAVAFHELGHYFDMHAAYGVMGDGLATDSCLQDTPDESVPLRETLADLTALVLYKKLYPGLTYTIDTSENSCSFGPLGTTTASVHDAACISDPVQISSFENTRPANDPFDGCNYSTGYNQSSVYQAWWEILNNASCSMEAPYGCSFDAANPDGVMEAMLYAMSVSNLQSYVQFFENMEIIIAWQYPDLHAVFVDSLIEHDIYPQPEPEPDTDRDGVVDSEDNCLLVANPTQCNYDGDLYGNHCDADFNQSGSVDFSDLGAMKEVFFENDRVIDMNCSGSVDFTDLGMLKSSMFQPPGPSGLE